MDLLKKIKLKKILVFSVLVVIISSIFLYAVMKRNKSFDIPIAMITDEGYVFPTIVAITSIMENKNPETKYSFYIMHPGELPRESEEKLVSLEKKYKKIKVNLIDMMNEYKDVINVGTHHSLNYPLISI